MSLKNHIKVLAGNWYGFDLITSIRVSSIKSAKFSESLTDISPLWILMLVKLQLLYPFKKNKCITTHISILDSCRKCKYTFLSRFIYLTLRIRHSEMIKVEVNKEMKRNFTRNSLLSFTDCSWSVSYTLPDKRNYQNFLTVQMPIGNWTRNNIIAATRGVTSQRNRTVPNIRKGQNCEAEVSIKFFWNIHK